MPKALIIDDHSENIIMLEAFLGLYNVDALGATSGSEGFSMAQNYNPDIILLDLLMPDKRWDGYATCQALKSHPMTANIPIIAVTAAGNKELAFQAGVDYFLQRPFQTDSLRKILAELMLLA